MHCSVCGKRVATSQGLSAHLSAKHTNYVAKSKVAVSLLSLALNQPISSQQVNLMLPPISEEAETPTTLARQDTDGAHLPPVTAVPGPTKEYQLNSDRQAQISEDDDFFDQVQYNNNGGV
ncbi:hypothetical protein HK102_013352, partial [Quaeritorhiza haematococci]